MDQGRSRPGISKGHGVRRRFVGDVVSALSGRHPPYEEGRRPVSRAGSGLHGDRDQSGIRDSGGRIRPRQGRPDAVYGRGGRWRPHRHEMGRSERRHGGGVVPDARDRRPGRTDRLRRPRVPDLGLRGSAGEGGGRGVEPGGGGREGQGRGAGQAALRAAARRCQTEARERRLRELPRGISAGCSG